MFNMETLFSNKENDLENSEMEELLNAEKGYLSNRPNQKYSKALQKYANIVAEPEYEAISHMIPQPKEPK